LTFYAGQGKQQSKLNVKIIMEPAFPHFYVPNGDGNKVFDDFKTLLQNNWGNDNIVYETNAVVFQSPCDQVNVPSHSGLSINFDTQ
jgi:hypothetical protein